MEPQVYTDCETTLHPRNILIGDGDCGDIPSSQNYVTLQQPVKKQTRQWAAWTRQEEESFFTALRQVGKNFEKITCRVQSKNKDQVRHYYYRLVRRMNKLLGPELCLDAKNSKDTNAAMLRWWSLLEKYSCKASKLHLKPRRFKIFIETLEHQLLKDRKKNMKKRRPLVENCVSSVPTTVSSQSRASGNDTHAGKVVLLDGQNMQKLGPGKSSLRRNVNIGITRRNSKGDSSTVRTMRQRQKSSMVSTAAYKRWEKAVIAGVSLVADAAEHLERTAIDKDVHITAGENSFERVGEDILPSTSPKNIFVESNNVPTSMKLKLQLFPIDEATRRALELDNHNPHLELTLSTRKKISSVLEHLNRKWGNSSIASGELTLFPYCVQRESLVGYQRWSPDSVLSAADVYTSIGSPPVFRLRYGWFSNPEPPSATFQPPLSPSGILGDTNTNMKEQTVVSIRATNSSTYHQSERLMDHCKDQLVSVTERNASVPPAPDFPRSKTGSSGSYLSKYLLESSDHAPTTSWHEREAGNGAIMRQVEYKDNRRLSNGTALSAGEWADSLTNISVGDLLSEGTHDMEANSGDPTLPGSSQYTQQIPFSCDSFDAAIAAHIHRHQSRTTFQPHVSSIWDAEETCDAFSFQKNSVFREEGQSSSPSSSPDARKELAGSSEGFSAAIEELPEVEGLMDDDSVSGDHVDDDLDHADHVNDDPANGDPMDTCPSDPQLLDNAVKDLNGFTDIYWPDSLGPLDLDIPSCRYYSEDLILSDSLSGLNRLIASSLDAFQNCSFFSLEKKEASSTVESQGPSSFSDYKVGSQV